MPEETQTIKSRFTQLDAERSGILTRCEQYAEWTLPWLFASEHATATESLPKSGGSIGARCVNHLSNHLVQVMFPANRPFFRSQVGDETRTAAAQAGLTDSQLDMLMANIERQAMMNTNIASHRNKAVDAAKYLIVTGNTCLFYFSDKKRKTNNLKCNVYHLRDYVVKRAWDGSVSELITRDKKKLGSFNSKAQAVIKAAAGTSKTAESECELFTYVKWDSEKQKYIVTQAADNVDLQLDKEVSYSRDLLPWNPLTWHRKHGEDYGRGLVEDYEMAFNAHAELTTALDQFVAIMADIKRFVRPGSQVSVEDLDASDPGSWHPGEEGDVWASDLGKAYDLRTVDNRINALEQELGSAFMLSTATTRQAERVTAEEIKMQIRELETSHGGIYSKLADEWQMPLAAIILSNAGIQPDLDVTPFIITGMDAMSRSAESEAVYQVFADLAVTQQLGTWGRWLDEEKFLQLACSNRGVDKEKLFKKGDVVKQEDQQRQQAAIQAQEREMQTKMAGEIAAQ